MPTSPDGWTPADSDYSRHGEVRVWSDLEEYLSHGFVVNGVDVIRLPSGDHLDVLVAGDDLPPDQCVTVFFTGAMPSREGRTPPFFSGVNLGRAIGGRYICFSDPLVGAEESVSLGWYAGRSGDHVQEAVAAVIAHVSRALNRQMLLVGGSGGGFAALEQTRRASAPVSAFVWNPQTDILRYLPAVAQRYLTTALGISDSQYSQMTDDDRRRAAQRAGIELSVIGRGTSAIDGGGRVLVLQNATDWHVADHMGPYVDAADLTSTREGVWSDSKQAQAWLVADLGDGHAVPPRATLESALRLMSSERVSAVDAVERLLNSELARLPDPETMPTDLRGQAGRDLGQALRATVDECGVVRASPSGSPLPGAVRLSVEVTGSRGVVRRDLPSGGLAIACPGATSATMLIRDGLGHDVGRITAPVVAADERLGVLVVGSCVSRDAIPFVRPSTRLTGYIARQSLISAFAAPSDLPPEIEDLDSPFQRRMMAADFSSSLPTRVRDLAPGTDVVVWDLVDERLGVFVWPDGRATTRTIEWQRLHPDGAVPEGARHVAFGTDEHLALFERALVHWDKLLSESGMLSRTVLLAPRWAERTTEGAPTPKSFGVDAATANATTERYLDLIRASMPVPVVGRSVTTAAGDDHHWGPAPFHFDDATEHALAAELARHTPQPTDLGGTTRSEDGSVVVSAGPSGPAAVVVGATVPKGCKVAYHLVRGGAKVEATSYGEPRPHAFWRLEPGRYVVRAFVILPSGARTSVASRPVTLG